MDIAKTKTRHSSSSSNQPDLQRNFFLAVRRKDVSKVNDLISDGLDPNCVYDDHINGGMTALHSSVIANNRSMVECLLTNGAQVNLPDKDGETPIFGATFDCEDSLREILFKNGADANFKNKSGKSPLMKLIENIECNNLKIRYSVIFDFLQRCNDFHQKDTYGRTLLHLVSVIHESCFIDNEEEHNCRNFLQYLVSKNVSVNCIDFLGQTALHAAAASCCLEAVECLVNRGCITSVRDNNLQTPLHRLGLHPNRPEYENIIKLMLRGGCMINSVDYLGRMPIHYVCASHETCKEAIQVMVMHKAIVKHRDKCGMNPLHLSVHPGVVTDYSDVVANKQHSENIAGVVEALVCNGVAINEADQDAFTPLHYAVRQRNIPAIETLLRLGADPYLKTKTGETALHRATLDTRVLDLIIDHMKQLSVSVDLDITDNYGSTPLHWAVSFLELGAVKQLVLENCRHISDGAGRNPADLAVLFRFACLYEPLGIYYHRGIYPIQFKVSLQHFHRFFDLLMKNKQTSMKACDTEKENQLKKMEKVDFDETVLEGFILKTKEPASGDKNDSEMENGSDGSVIDLTASVSYNDGTADLADEMFSSDENIDESGTDRDSYDDSKSVGEDEKDESCVTEIYPSIDQECPEKDELYLDCPLLQTIYHRKRKVSLVEWQSHLILHQQSLSGYTQLVLDAQDMGLINNTVENESIAYCIYEIMRKTAEQVSEVKPYLYCEITLAGSRSEGTKICCPDEFDFSWNLHRFSEAFFVEESDECPPEFVRLRLKKEFKGTKFADFVTTDGTLDGRKLIRSLYFAINEVLIAQNFQLMGQLYCRKYLMIDKGSIDNLAFRWVGHVYKDLLVEVDIVPRLVFPEWKPKQINIKNDLYASTLHTSEMSFFAVVTKTPDERFVKDWQQYFRIDVAQLESSLIRRAPEAARKGFILLKALRDTLYMPQIYDEDISNDYIKSFLTTYMLKTCLLHELNDDCRDECMTTDSVFSGRNSNLIKINEAKHDDTTKLFVTEPHTSMTRKLAIDWASRILKRLCKSVKKGTLLSFFAPDVNLLINQSAAVVNDKHLIEAECICLRDLFLLGTVDLN